MDEMVRMMFAVTVGVVKLIVGIIGAFIDVAKYGLHLFRGSKGPTTHGDATWASDKQLRKAGNFEPGGFIGAFTKSGKPVYSVKNRGALVLAGPGQGKSQIILANFVHKKHMHITQRQHLVVHDPAGELFEVGGPILAALGYDVAKIDMINPDQGIRYDVQSFLKPGSINFGSDLRSLCELLIEPEAQSRQPHFVEYARKMLQDVITLNLVFEGGTRNLSECVAEILSDAKRKALVKRMEKLSYDFNAMEIFTKMNGEEGTAMLSTSLRKLDPWTLDNIRRISEITPTVERPRGRSFEDMFGSDGPCALFIRTGLSPGGGDFARAVFGNAVNTIRRTWDQTGQANPRGTQVFIDEAAKLGKCVALLDGHTELRKANFSQMLSYVSFAAMHDCFGADAETLFNGCDHIILPGNQDMKTNEKYSVMIGEMTVESGSRSENSYGESTGKNEQARRLIKADEFRRAAFGRAFAVVGNLAVDGLKVSKPKRGKLVFR